ASAKVLQQSIQLICGRDVPHSTNQILLDECDDIHRGFLSIVVSVIGAILGEQLHSWKCINILSLSGLLVGLISRVHLCKLHIQGLLRNDSSCCLVVLRLELLAMRTPWRVELHHNVLILLEISSEGFISEDIDVILVA